MRHDPDVQRAADRFQLGLPRSPVVGRAGELLGRGTGSSLEFQDYRQYIPGDDLRHLDWAAYARTDSLMVRLYREEISPQTQILMDCSQSMTTGGEAKSRMTRQLAALFALLAAQLGGRPAVLPLLDERPLPQWGLDALDRIASVSFSGRGHLEELLADHAIPTKRQAVRIVISDFLFPHDPGSLIRKLAAEAGSLWVIQLLNAWEAAPTPLGGRRLIDAESQLETNLMIDRKAIEAYLVRLKRLQDELALSCRRVHALFATVIAERGLMTLCRDDLCQVGMLRAS